MKVTPPPVYGKGQSVLFVMKIRILCCYRELFIFFVGNVLRELLCVILLPCESLSPPPVHEKGSAYPLCAENNNALHLPGTTDLPCVNMES